MVAFFDVSKLIRAPCAAHRAQCAIFQQRRVEEQAAFHFWEKAFVRQARFS
jgi:hypothetical protein